MATAIATAAPATPTPTPAPLDLAPGLVWLPGEFVAGRQPDGNSLVWDSGQGLVVMDSGRHPVHTDAIVAQAQGHAPGIVALINSHWHLDHVGGNAELRRHFPGLAVYAGDGVNRALTRFLAKYQQDLQTRVAAADTSAEDRAGYQAELALLADPDALRPTEPVTGDRTLAIGDLQLELHIAEHGASATDLWVYDPRTRVLAAGDLVTLPAPLFDTACPRQWQATLQHLEKADFQTLVPGHGAPMNRAQFVQYRTAFDHLLACAADGKPNADCSRGWIDDTRMFSPSTDSELTRGLLGYYLDNNLKPENLARYCSD